MTPSGLVSLLTDFGPGSVYVGQMHAVILQRAQDLRIVDLAHDCPPGAVASAAYMLQRSFRHFPEGTVHVVVVDPGVGSSRAVLVARACGHIFVAPDNGLLGPVLAEAGDAEVRRVENRELMNEIVSSTFHGRDIFAPLGAYLATGGRLADVGPETDAEMARPGPEIGDRSIDGAVLLVNRFGNLITNIPRSMVQALGEPSRIRVQVGPSFLNGLVMTFADVPRGVALAYIGSGDHLEIAVNGGRACDLLAMAPGEPIHVRRRD